MSLPASAHERALALLGTVRRRRRGVAAALCGPAGIGKTHTAEALLAQLGCRTLKVHAARPWPALLAALPPADGVPRWAQETLRRAAERLEAAPEDLAPAVAALLAAHAPLVLLAEDLHETQSARLSFWRELAAAVQRGQGVGLLTTSRAAAPPEFRAFTVEALSSEQTRALMESELGPQLPAAALTFVRERACGNPLFTREYLRFLVQRGHLWSDGHRWHWRPPPGEVRPQTVEAVIAEWLDMQAGEAATALLAARSLLGPAVGEDGWRQVSGLSAPEFSTALALLQQSGMLEGHQLGHPLFGEVAVGELPPAARSALITRAVLALEETQPVLAARWLPQAELPDPYAAALLERAGGVLRREHDPAGAARCFLQAAQRRSGPARAELCRSALAALGGFAGEEAWALLELGRREEPGNEAFAVAEARLLAQRGQAEDAERCLTALPDNPTTALERLRLRQQTQNPAGVMALWQARPELHALPEALRIAVHALTSLGEPDAAQALLTAHQDAFDDPEGRIFWLEGQLHLSYLREDYLGALATLDALLPLLEGQDELHLAHTLSNRAMLRHGAGQLGGALSDCQQAMAAYLALGTARYALEDHAKWGGILMDLGQYPQAETVLLEGLAAVSRTHHLTERGKAEAALALLYLEWQPPQASALARRYSRAGIRSARAGMYAPSQAQCLAIAARVEAELGDPASALTLADEAQAMCRRCGGLPVAAALATFARGLALARLGRLLDALEALQAAQATFTAHGLITLAQRVGSEIDILSGDEVSARRRLAQVEALNFKLAADRLRRAFPQLAAQEPGDGNDRLLALGPLRFQRGGRELAVRGRQARKLFGLLLQARLEGRSSVLLLTLIDALYPNEAEPDAAAALQQLVYRVRGLYGAASVLTVAGGYALGSASDAEAFLNGSDFALWRGPLLADADVEEGPAAELLRGAFLKRWSASPEAREALRAGLLLLDDEVGNADWLRSCLDGLLRLGEPRRARQVYRRARTAWATLDLALPEDYRTFLRP